MPWTASAKPLAFAGEATDPYGHGAWSLSDGKGKGDGDGIYFDYSTDRDHGTVRIHSVINCETGHFIEDFQNTVVPLAEGLAEAERQIDLAMCWFFDNGYPRFVGKRLMRNFLKSLKFDIERAAQGRI